MGRLGVPEMIIIALVVILLFGAKKLPEIANAMGKAIKEFRKAGREDLDGDKKISQETKDESKS